MTAKPKKAKRKKLRRRPEKIGDLHASVEDDLLIAGGSGDGRGGALEPAAKAENLVARGY
jgi:hypothetical protein